MKKKKKFFSKREANQNKKGKKNTKIKTEKNMVIETAKSKKRAKRHLYK